MIFIEAIFSLVLSNAMSINTLICSQAKKPVNPNTNILRTKAATPSVSRSNSNKSRRKNTPKIMLTLMHKTKAIGLKTKKHDFSF